jgi:hypothetical protein
LAEKVTPQELEEIKTQCLMNGKELSDALTESVNNM